MRRGRVLGATAALMLALAMPAAADGGKRSVTIEIGTYDSSEESAIWLSYAASLSLAAIASGALEQAPLGPFSPTFEQELAARRMMIKIWREQQGKDDKPFAYADALSRIEAAGFLPEYVWTVHWRSTWKQPPADLRIAEFYIWQRKELAGHEPRTGARVRITAAPESPASAASR